MFEAKKYNRSWNIRLFAVLSLSIYLFAVIESSVVHQWHHHEHAQDLHSEEKEKDSCHQAIYHQGEACGHETHVQEISFSCELCDIILTPQEHAELAKLKNPIPPQQFLLNKQYVWTLKANFLFTYPLRGPPAVA